MDLRVGYFQTRDGLSLYFEDWSPKEPRGTVVLVHGIGDRSCRYRHFARYLNQHHFRVCLYDQRGHGKSQGYPVYVKRFESYCDDLKDFADFCQRGEKSPHFLVGHSMGGQIILNFLAQYPDLFQAACSSSANILTALKIPSWMHYVGHFLFFLVPKLKFKGVADAKWLTQDPQVVQDYLEDPLVYNYVTARLGKEIIDNQVNLFLLTHQIKTPLLMLHGSEDHYCSTSGTQRFFDAIQLDKKQLKIYEGLYHELFNEPRKEEVFQDILRWFSAFLPESHGDGRSEELSIDFKRVESS